MCIPFYCGCLGYAVGCILGYRVSESFAHSSIHNEVYDPASGKQAPEIGSNNNKASTKNQLMLDAVERSNDDIHDDEFFIVKKDEYII